MKMKLRLIVLTLAALPTFALANPRDVMQCTTYGDALDSVGVAVNTIPDDSDHVLISLTSMEPTTTGFTASLPKGQFDQQIQDGHLVVVGQSNDSIEFGGSVSNAALLVLDKTNGKFAGQLAVNGIVYTLHCQTY
jgi:hypothetical protein